MATAAFRIHSKGMEQGCLLLLLIAWTRKSNLTSTRVIESFGLLIFCPSFKT